MALIPYRMDAKHPPYHTSDLPIADDCMVKLNNDAVPLIYKEMGYQRATYLEATSISHKTASVEVRMWLLQEHIAFELKG